LELHEMAAFLKLTPTETFSEYQHLVRHFEFEKETRRKLGPLDQFQSSRYFQIAASEESLERYRLRLKELSRLPVWARSGRIDLDSLLTRDYRAAVIDLSLDNPEVRAITAARALQVLWRQGEATRTQLLGRRPRKRLWRGTLVVIDEAHLFAPATPAAPHPRLVSERAARFCGQGTKVSL